jgi:hypothetical protein
MQKQGSTGYNFSYLVSEPVVVFNVYLSALAAFRIDRKPAIPICMQFRL